MAWGTYTRAQVGPSKAVKTGIGDWFREKQHAACGLPFEVYFASIAHTDTSYSEITSFLVRVPEYAEGMQIEFRPEVRVDAGSASWRLVIGARQGTAVTGIVNTSYASSDPASIALLESEANTVITVSIEGLVTSPNTFDMQNTDRLTARFSKV